MQWAEIILLKNNLRCQFICKNIKNNDFVINLYGNQKLIEAENIILNLNTLKLFTQTQLYLMQKLH